VTKTVPKYSINVSGFEITFRTKMEVQVSLDPTLLDSYLDTFCGDCVTDEAQGLRGDPVNTRTGAFTYPVSDLSMQTSAGLLEFKRQYSSASIGAYSSPLGYG
jgi:hypothetical protein